MSVQSRSDAVKRCRSLLAEGNFCGEITGWERLSGGGNNRVYRFRCGGVSAVCKEYTEEIRLIREYETLELLNREGIGSVPEPILMDAASRIGIYGYVEGMPVAGKINRSDVDALYGFLRAVNNPVIRGKARDIPPAAEACFSFAALSDNLNERIDRLRVVSVGSPFGGKLRGFLEQEIVPAVEDVMEHIRVKMRAVGLEYDRVLPGEYRILNPSDFGFHNAVRKKDGTLSFLDFEYFGWDDPAKTICDVLLHPRERWSREEKRYFLESGIALWKRDPHLADRIRIGYPAWCMKWSLIMLNEFLPQHMQRRKFAGAVRMTDDRRLALQLRKSERMLERARTAMNGFVYGI